MANEPVKLIECPRDAWQGLPRHIPTQLKAEYLRGLIEAGFKHIDAVSFVSPKAVPQMADSEQVLAQIGIPGDVEIIGIVVNEKGVDRAITTKRVTTIGFPCSVSPTFLLRNQNQTPEQNLAVLKTIKKLADVADIGLVVYLSMAFGNPYRDPWSETEIQTAIARIVDLGVQSISLADTIGIGDRELIGRIIAAAMKPARDCELGVHLHSTRADAIGKILAAYDAGCRRFDSALGGLGGCPFAQDTLVGNIPTESVITGLNERGIKLPLETDNVTPLNTKIGADFA